MVKSVLSSLAGATGILVLPITVTYSLPGLNLLLVKMFGTGTQTTLPFAMTALYYALVPLPVVGPSAALLLGRGSLRADRHANQAGRRWLGRIGIVLGCVGWLVFLCFWGFMVMTAISHRLPPIPFISPQRSPGQSLPG